MIFAVFKVMAFRLWRDKGALLSTFVLPPLVFFVFAAIFSGSAGGRLSMTVAIYDGVQSIESAALVTGLSDRDDITLYAPNPQSEDSVEALILSGSVDAGLLITFHLDDVEHAPVSILTDPSNGIAGSFLAGTVQQNLATLLPAISLRRNMKYAEQVMGDFTPEQVARISNAEARLQHTPLRTGPGFAANIQLETGQSGVSLVTYYAGAIAFMFLLFSASHGAAMETETGEAGLMERLTIGGANVGILTAGGLLFLVVQGIVQALVIFAGAEWVYGLGLGQNPLGFSAVVVVFALSASTLTMAINGLCKTRKQALTVSSFVILIWSAVGGSMVPRFLMPNWLQDLGWLTPNTWAVDAYLQAVWRGAPLWDVILALLPLVAVSALCFYATVVLTRRRIRVK